VRAREEAAGPKSQSEAAEYGEPGARRVSGGGHAWRRARPGRRAGVMGLLTCTAPATEPARGLPPVRAVGRARAPPTPPSTGTLQQAQHEHDTARAGQGTHPPRRAAPHHRHPPARRPRGRPWRGQARAESESLPCTRDASLPSGRGRLRQSVEAQSAPRMPARRALGREPRPVAAQCMHSHPSPAPLHSLRGHQQARPATPIPDPSQSAGLCSLGGVAPRQAPLPRCVSRVARHVPPGPQPLDPRERSSDPRRSPDRRAASSPHRPTLRRASRREPAAGSSRLWPTGLSARSSLKQMSQPAAGQPGSSSAHRARRPC
jgi:hypothetical protein